MTPTPVGMRCPECSAQRTKVRTLGSTTTEPRVTIALIIVCVVLFLATNGFSGGSGRLWNDWLLYGPAVHFGHDYWRLVTSGFLHSGPIHILFNMYLLWLLGNLLEPTLGSGRFAALYFTALLWGAFGALLLLGGRIADYTGRKRTFVIGLLGFAGASAIGGLAPNQELLFAARSSGSWVRQRWSSVRGASTRSRPTSVCSSCSISCSRS